MERELRFNICQIPAANKDIKNLDVLIRDNISPLLYASHFGAQRFSRLINVNDATMCKLQGLSSARFMEWLDVMSVTDKSSQAHKATIHSSKAGTQSMVQ